ncbi:MAG: O-antigen ligase family protein, partial [Caldilineaceae bacterium]|nr:O-antigen ligase family protein [Caldilineaceae bacterium]
LLWLEPCWIALVMPSLLVRDWLWDPWVHPWLIVALLLFWPLRLWTQRQIAPATPLNWPVLLLLIWSPVGLWASVDLARSLHALGFLVLGCALYFALLNWPPTQQYPWRIGMLLAGAGCALAMLGPALLLRIPMKLLIFPDDLTKSGPADWAFIGETVNPNVLAGALLLPLLLLLALTLRPRWAKRRWMAQLLWAPILLIGMALLLSQSRGAYLALLVSVIVLIALRWPWIGISFGVGLFAAAFVLITTQVSVSMGGAIVEASKLAGTLPLALRVEVWHRALWALCDHLLTGIGIGTFDLVIPQLYPYTPGQRGVIPHAHNLLLQVGVDLGLPGLLLYGWLLVSTCGVLIRVLRYSWASASVQERDTALQWALAAGTLAAFIALMTHGMVDAVTWGTKLAFLPWLLFALTAVLSLDVNRK